jgi:Zn-dependent protease
MDIFFSIIAFVIVVVSLVVRDLVRGKAAQVMGDSTPYAWGRMTWNPKPHFEPLAWIVMVVSCLRGLPIGWTQEMPSSPFGKRRSAAFELLLVVWGFLPHLFIALVCAMIIRAVLPVFDRPFQFPSSTGGQNNGPYDLNSFVLLILNVNLLLAFFNLLPLYPLDGLRILKFFMPETSYRKYYDFVRAYAPHIFLIGLVLLPFIDNRLDFFGRIIAYPTFWLARLLLG